MGCAPSKGNADGTADSSNNNNNNNNKATQEGAEFYENPTLEARVNGSHMVVKILDKDLRSKKETAGDCEINKQQRQEATPATDNFSSCQVVMKTNFVTNSDDTSVLVTSATGEPTSQAQTSNGMLEIAAPGPGGECKYRAAAKAVMVPSGSELEGKIRSVCDISRGGLVSQQLKRLRTEPDDIVRWPTIFSFDGSGNADFLSGQSGLDVPGLRVMTEWCEGGNVHRLMGNCSVSLATVLLNDVASAVETLHHLGSVHMNLHPGNIMIREIEMSPSYMAEGLPEERYQVGDVGWGPLWSQLSPEERWHFQGARNRTAGRFPPEQIKSRQSLEMQNSISGFNNNPNSSFQSGGGTRLIPEEKTDVWAFGVFAYALLYGQQPFGLDLLETDDMESYFRCITENEIHFPNESAIGEAVPLSVRSMISSCLAKDAYLRPRSIVHLIARCLPNEAAIAFVEKKGVKGASTLQVITLHTDRASAAGEGGDRRNSIDNLSINSSASSARSSPHTSPTGGAQSGVDTASFDFRRATRSYSVTSAAFTANRSNSMQMFNRQKSVTAIDTFSVGFGEMVGAENGMGEKLMSSMISNTSEGFPRQTTNDILIAPVDFKVSCSNCHGGVAPLAFRCDTCPTFILCSDCLVEVGDDHDETHQLTSYAVEEMDQLRLETSLGAGLLMQSSAGSSAMGSGTHGVLSGNFSSSGKDAQISSAPHPLQREGTAAPGPNGVEPTSSLNAPPALCLKIENLEEASLRGVQTPVPADRSPNALALEAGDTRRPSNMDVFFSSTATPAGATSPPSTGLMPPSNRKASVFVKTQNLTAHEKTVFSMMGQFPDTQLSSTKKSFAGSSSNNVPSNGGSQNGGGGGGLKGMMAAASQGGTTIGQRGGKKQLMSEEDARGDLDPNEVIDDFVAKAKTLALMTPNNSARIEAEISFKSEISLCSFELMEVPERLQTDDLTKLCILDLSNNQIELLPEWIGLGPVNLTQLRLGSNRLSKLPESLGDLSKLEILEVNHNQLTDIPVTLVFIDTLKTLALDYNRFNSIPDCIWCMPQLRTLYVAANPNILEWPAIEKLSPMGHLTIGVDNHPKLWRSYRDLRIAEECHRLNVVWNKVYPDVVIPDRLYLGSLKSAQLLQVYERLDIGAVLTVARGLDPVIGQTMRHKTIVVDDIVGASFEKSFEEAFAFIDSCPTENRKGAPAVLVHCFAGMSRSATCVIGYLMTNHKMRLDDAYMMVKEARAATYPNDGFFQQLVDLDGQLYPSSAGHRPLKLEGLGRGEIPGLCGKDK